jgi:hypothetical protein
VIDLGSDPGASSHSDGASVTVAFEDLCAYLAPCRVIDLVGHWASARSLLTRPSGLVLARPTALLILSIRDNSHGFSPATNRRYSSQHDVSMTRDTRVYCPPHGLPCPCPTRLERGSRFTRSHLASTPCPTPLRTACFEARRSTLAPECSTSRPMPPGYDRAASMGLPRRGGYLVTRI